MRDRLETLVGPPAMANVLICRVIKVGLRVAKHQNRGLEVGIHQDPRGEAACP
jgi:hypothetical protein